MSTTIERVSEEEVAFEFAQYIKKQLQKPDDASDKAAAAKLSEDVSNLVGKGDLVGLLSKVAAEDGILSALLHAPESGILSIVNIINFYIFLIILIFAEAENAFTIFFSLIRKQPEATFAEHAQKLMLFLTGNTQDLPLLRLRVYVEQLMQVFIF